MNHHTQKPDKTPEKQQPAGKKPAKPAATHEPETGGPKGPEPTRYGDWEKGGIVSDF